MAPIQPPIEPPPSAWDFPSGEAMEFFAPDEDCLGEGADLEPGTVLEAYRHGIFPMPLGGRGGGGRTAWWSPARRGIMPLDGLRITRSLRKSAKRFEITVDAAFDEVITACADPTRYGSWISDDIIAAYRRLHQLGWVHSVEAWSSNGTLAGGLYGVSINGLFAGESMFHRETDASKVALIGLVHLLTADGLGGQRLLDVQWVTEHLASLGAIEVTRSDYLSRLAQALRGSAPDFGQKISNPTSMVSSSAPASGRADGSIIGAATGAAVGFAAGSVSAPPDGRVSTESTGTSTMAGGSSAIADGVGSAADRSPDGAGDAGTGGADAGGDVAGGPAGVCASDGATGPDGADPG